MNPHNRPHDLSNSTHTVLNWIACAGVGVIVLWVVFLATYYSVPEANRYERLLSVITPAVFSAVVASVVAKVILAAALLLIRNLADKQYDKWTKE